MNQGKALLRDFNRGLEGQIAHAKAHREKIVMEVVAVPE